MTDPHWFEPLADHMGPAYLRYSFTRGTAQEVEFLIDNVPLVPGTRVLDVGCGPGRHARALAERGFDVLGIDISETFIDLARDGAPDSAVFERMDARAMDFEGRFDAVISLCQGAFGLAGGSSLPSPHDPDGEILRRMARAVRPGGCVAFSAFSAYFQVRELEDTDDFDAEAGVNHEWTTILDREGQPSAVELWTSCFTPRELRLLAREAGLVPRSMWSVTPGAYAVNAPDVGHPEFLMVADRPG